jgi:hypothetical protein
MTKTLYAHMNKRNLKKEEEWAQAGHGGAYL